MYISMCMSALQSTRGRWGPDSDDLRNWMWLNRDIAVIFKGYQHLVSEGGKNEEILELRESPGDASPALQSSVDRVNAIMCYL